MGNSAADTDDNNINLALWQARNFQLKTDADISPAKLADIHRNNTFQLSDIVNNFNISADFATAQLAKEQRCYAAVIDDSNRSVGLDNFSAKALSLAADCKTENGDWKSGIAENSMLQLDFVKNALGSRSTLETKLELEKSNLINRQLLSGNDNNFVKFSAVKEPRIVSSPIHHHKNVVQSRDDNNPKLDYDSDTIRLTKDSDHKDCKSKRIRLDGEAGKKDSKEQLGFRSARDQLVAEQASKNQKSFAQNQKKSLGSRPRNQCYAKFIPPNRDKDDSDDDISASRKSDPASAPDVKAEAHPKLKGVDQQLIDLVVSEIMDHGPPVEWDHIAGLEYAKATIKEIVIWPMLRPDLFTGLRGPPKGILLFGPPGTGKTLIGKCIASQSRATFFSISASSLTSKWIGQGEKMVRALFVVAGMHQPAVIFIDEIDSLLSQRSDTEHESSRRIKTEFLIHLDGATTSSEDRILVVGATNRPHEIDEAARRRLVKRLYIPLPDAPARKQMMTTLMRDQPFRLSDDDVDAIVGRTDGFSGADVTNLCKEAALGPIRSLQGLDIARVSKEQVRPIEVADFEAALKHVKASVSNNDLRLYEDWNKTFGCGST